MHNRRISWPRGKTLGGSSSINGLIYIRGQRQDFDLWRQLGNAGWSYDDVLPYFRKAEDQEHGANDFHGAGGPLGVSDLKTDHPLHDAFIAGAQEAGYKFNPDFNGAEQEGVGPLQLTVRGRRRCSAAVGYLNPVKTRRNLRIEVHALTHNVVLEGRRAVGVRYSQHGVMREARAKREVLLCGGAINSPQILQLSGIGPGALLQSVGIAVKHDLPGVGENLLDHPESIIIWELNRPLPPEGVMDADCALFVNRLGGDPRPDLMYHTYQLPFTFNTERLGYPVPEHCICMTPNIPRSRSVGRMWLLSSNPEIKPALDFQYFTDADGYDEQTIVDGLKIAREVANTEPFKGWIKREVAPGPKITSDSDLSEYGRAVHHTVYHPSGTCRMGAANDELAVVDPQLRVRGIEGLSIADGSIFPTMPTVNPMVGTFMIGEKAADLVRQRTGSSVAAAGASA
jgi:choline dehydrogenase